jgi:hypothetical protein
VNGAALGAASVVRASAGGSPADADLLWTGDRLVVAWTNVLQIEYRVFDGDLVPLGAETLLAPSSAIESNVSLCAFGAGWAAAFRSGEQGLEKVVVVSGDTTWTTPLQPLGPPHDRPALVALDDQHLLVAFTVGTDPTDSGGITTPRVRAAVLMPSSAGAVEPFAVDPSLAPYATDPASTQRGPRAVRIGGQAYLAWESSWSGDGSAGDHFFLAPVRLDSTEPHGVALGPEVGLPLGAPAVGIQSNGHLGASDLYPQGALIFVWEDPSTARSNVIVDFRPAPFVELP